MVFVLDFDDFVFQHRGLQSVPPLEDKAVYLVRVLLLSSLPMDL